MGRFHRHDDGTEHSHDSATSGAATCDPATSDPATSDPATSDPATSDPASSRLAERVGDHAGYSTGNERIDVLEAIFGENDRLAAANRSDFDAAGVRVVNLMSSPGAGKTQLLTLTLAQLRDRLRVGVVEGDIRTSLDADRLQGLGASVVLINTGDGFGGECHLDAPMIRSVLPRLPLCELDLVVVENVGNLVCPAEFSVGEHARAMVFSVTEGEEKPLKYPVMFRSVELVVINKIDLLPYLDFDLDLFLHNLSVVNPGVMTLMTSARTGAGVPEWVEWLTAQVAGRPA